MTGHCALAWIQDESIACAIFPHRTIDIGRSRGSHLRLWDDTRVSNAHCVITSHHDGLEIADTGSRNGTRINGVTISDPRKLCPGDDIEVGNTELTVVFEFDRRLANEFRLIRRRSNSQRFCPSVSALCVTG